jgi:hypothetical protein
MRRAANGLPLVIQLEVQLGVVQPQGAGCLPSRPPPLRQRMQRPYVIRYLQGALALH